METQTFVVAVLFAVATGIAVVKAFAHEWRNRMVGTYTVLAAGFAAFLVQVADRLVK